MKVSLMIKQILSEIVCPSENRKKERKGKLKTALN